MPRPFLPLFVVPLALLLPLAHLVSPSTTSSSSSSATAAAADAIFLQRPPASSDNSGVAAHTVAAGCSRGAEAAARAVVEGCTDDIVRSFFGVRGSDLCCHALETVGDGCYRAVLAGSPFADLYGTILGNVCGGASAPSPRADDGGAITAGFSRPAANAEIISDN